MACHNEAIQGGFGGTRRTVDMPSELVFRVFVLPRPGPRVGAGAGQGRELPDHGPLRLALVTYMRSEGQLRRAGVNLNQAVAELNATGAAPVWLGRVAQRVAAAVAHNEAAACLQLLRQLPLQRVPWRRHCCCSC